MPVADFRAFANEGNKLEAMSPAKGEPETTVLAVAVRLANERLKRSRTVRILNTASAAESNRRWSLDRTERDDIATLYFFALLARFFYTGFRKATSEILLPVRVKCPRSRVNSTL